MKMNNLMKYALKSSLPAVLCLSINACIGQEIDQSRMDRDLAVAEDILISLLKNDNEHVTFFSTGAASTYLPDYGVMFNLMGSGHLIGEDFGTNFSFSFSDDDCEG